MKIKIYSGLSLNRTDIKKVLPSAIFAPPIERAQIYADIKNKVNVIGIVDGKFMQSLAVSPTEILDAMRSGIRVYGSSSLGALRAVELARFNMVGCGEIFKHIGQSKYFRDDYLGQVFFQDDQVGASLPFMDLQFSIKIMLAKELISKRHGDLILDSYQELYFADRNWHQLETKLKAKAPSENWGKLIKKFSVMIKSQKHIDGIDLLKTIKRDLESIKKLNEQLF